MRQQHKPLQWIEKNFRFPVSSGRHLAGKPVGKYLLPEQRKMIREVFSPNGDIQSSLYIQGCRKVGKTMMHSMITWYLLNDPKRIGFQGSCMASIFQQSKLVYEQLISQKFNKKDIIFLTETIKQKKTKARLDFFANSPNAVLGLEGDMLIADEIAVYKNPDALLNLSTGGALAPDRFLKLFSSNPPLTDDHFSIDFLKSCSSDPNFKVHRFVLKAKEDWTKEENWAKANPFIAEYFNSKGKRFSYVMEFYRDYFNNRALNSKMEEHSFRRYLLGQFCSGENEFIDLNKIRECGDEVYSDSSVRWCVGADYSVTTDMTCLALCGWSQSKGKLFVKPFLYLPNCNKRRESQKRKLQQWEKAGYLTIQNREVLDGDQVSSDVIGFISERNIVPECIIFDKALSQYHIDAFKDFKTQAVRMSPMEMTRGIRELQRVGQDNGLYFIGRNDCLKWQFGNILVSEKSRNFVTMNRVSTSQNIDGPQAIALAMKYFTENKTKNYLIMSG